MRSLVTFENLFKFVVVALMMPCLSWAHDFSEGPDQGSFDWTRLYGTYRYVACENQGKPIWASNLKALKIAISNDPWGIQSPDPIGFSLVLSSDTQSILRLNWDFSDLNRGPQHSYDPQGNLVRTSDSYSTHEGAYNSLAWNFSHDSGIATMNIRAKDENEIEYTITRSSTNQPQLHRETCRLFRVRD